MANVPLWVSHSLYDMKVAQYNAEKKAVQTEADFKVYQANMQGTVALPMMQCFVVSM
jgi:hypothetical protein